MAPSNDIQHRYQALRIRLLALVATVSCAVLGLSCAVLGGCKTATSTTASVVHLSVTGHGSAASPPAPAPDSHPPTPSRCPEAEWTWSNDAGLAHFKALTQLRQLDLYGTNVSDAGGKALRRALPQLYIQLD